jgi:hypothetical protein
VKSNGSIYVSIVFAALAGYFTYQWWFNQNRVVKRTLGELAATLSVPGSEADIERFARVARLTRYLADNVRVSGGSAEPGLLTREALMTTASGWRPDGGGDVNFVDVDVKIDGETARAYVTAEVTTRDPQTRGQTVDSREAALSLIKREGVWLVSEVDVKDPSPPSPR